MVQRTHQPVNGQVRIGAVDERLANPRIQCVLRTVDGHRVVLLKVLQVFHSVVAVEHPDRLTVLQPAVTAGDRRQMAGACIFGKGRCGGRNTAQQQGNHSQSGQDFHRAGSLSSVFNAGNFPPLRKKQNLRFLMVTID
ncbi:hypothetical protein D3C76_954880 [compost metagenome]